MKTLNLAGTSPESRDGARIERPDAREGNSGSPIHLSTNPSIHFVAAALLLAGVASALAGVHYVDVNSTNATTPYTNWATAATNIQDAVDASVAGDEIIVMNGIYETGARFSSGTYNRVVIDKPLNVHSVNGPTVTTIAGDGVFRCAYLTDGAVLSGFTLTFGATPTNQSGGGVWCESASAVVTNCVLTGNSAQYGGGAYGGTLNNCTLTNNSAFYAGGGAYIATLNNCVLAANWVYGAYVAIGGAVYSCTLSNCTLTGNSAAGYGGGAYGGTLNNCALTGNWAYGNYGGSGGGAYEGALTNCMVAGNSAGFDGGGAYSGTLNTCTLTNNWSDRIGGGASQCTLVNCTLIGNSAYFGGGAGGGALNNCVLTSNSAGGYGGGASGGTLNNCTLTGNSANQWGGGADGSTLNNCTLSSNSATYEGGGAYSGTLNNCMLTANRAQSGGGAYNGTLTNCTLMGNSAYSGGGAYSAMLNRCVLTANWAYGDYPAGSGGGACSCTLNACVLTGNSAQYESGGAAGGTLTNCTLTANWAQFGGGAAGGTLDNCIIYYNSAQASGDNYSGSTLNYCCTTPLPSGAGSGNFVAEPQLAGNWHLSAGSPCRGAGSAAYASGLDLDGEAWTNPPSVGCNEYWSGSVTGALSAAILASYTNVAVGFAVDFQAVISGRVSASRWDFADGAVENNRPYASHAWAAAGDYVIELRAYNESYPAGVAASMVVHVVAQPVHYVSLSSPGPVWPYTNWVTAATNTQAAVDAVSVPGGLVLVSNGVYQAGATVVYGVSNRLAVTKPLTVQSVNGPANTFIQGYGPIGSNAVRCVYLTNRAVLSGFTLTNGATLTSGYYTHLSGGGVWCESASAVVTNCVLTGNSASYGGGASGATLNGCTLTGNSAGYGGGTYVGTLNNCTLSNNSAYEGGGADGATLNNCVLTGNSATGTYGYGGGAYGGTLNNCTLTGNSAQYGGGAAQYEGGGATEPMLNNCTLTGNSAQYGGGAYGGTLNNCTLRGNSAYGGGGATSGTLNNCVLTGNSATGTHAYGGGAFGAILNNCTLTGNSAEGYGGGGAYNCALNNCILYFNKATNGANFYQEPYSGALKYCCTTPRPTNGFANITNEPLFMDEANGNLRLQANSPCINAGNNAFAPAGPDLDGNPRVAGGTVDIGAYEFQSPASMISYAWLQQFNLPINPSTDTADPDGDAVDNYHEWLAGTNPTNAFSSPAQLAIAPSGTNVVLKWSTNAVGFTLQSTTNLLSPAAWVTNASTPVVIAGQNTVTNLGTGALQFYRLKH